MLTFNQYLREFTDDETSVANKTHEQYITEEHEHGDFIRDDGGKPVSYFHGTRNAFDEFKPNVKKKMQLGFGMHFTPDASKAEFYTQKGNAKGDNPNIHKVHIRAKNPLDIDQMYRKDTHPKHFALHQELYKGTGRQPHVDSEGHFCVHPDVTNPARAEKLIRKHGFDAVKYTAVHPGYSGGHMVKKDQYPAIVAMHPNQVHSAFHPIKEEEDYKEDFKGFQKNLRDRVMPAREAMRDLHRRVHGVSEELIREVITEEHIPVKIKQHPKNPDAYLAYHRRKRVGAAITWNDLHHGKFGIYKSETHPDYRKKGVMSQLYSHIEKTTGKQLHPSSALSDDGHKFWQHYRPEAVKDDLRNHTDKLIGKDVSHPTHGPAKIDSVGSGGVMGRMSNGHTYHLKKDHSEVQKHLNEDVLGDKIKAATKSNASYKILDSHPSTQGSTWNAGGCGVLAHALHKHTPGSKLVDVHNKTTGHIEHVAVHHEDNIYDGRGATPAKNYLAKFRKREMIPVHHELELTNHDPERAAKSGISTHPDLVSKTHSHLKKYLA